MGGIVESFNPEDSNALSSSEIAHEPGQATGNPAAQTPENHGIEVESPISLLTWGDLFPLLVDPRLSEPRDLVVTNTPPEIRSRLLTTLASAMVEKWASFQWARLVPAVNIDRGLADSRLSTRARNVLSRAGATSLQLALQLSANDIYDVRGAGAGTVHEIAEWLLTETLESLEFQARHGDARVALDHAQPDVLDPATAKSPESEKLLADLETVAAWMLVRGLGDTAMMSDEPYAPEAVTAARHRILNVTPASMGLSSDRPAVILKHALDEMSPAAIRVATARTFADEPATLQQLADEIGVSRERVRQIERGVFSDLSKVISPGGDLHHLAEAVARRVGSLLPLGRILEDFPSLTEDVESVHQPVWRVLDRLDPVYEIDQGWCASPTLSAVKDSTLAQLHDLSDEYGLFALDRLSELGIDDLGAAPPAWLDGWLTYCGVTQFENFILTRTGSLQDRASAALAIVGEPQTVDQFPDFVTEGRSPRSLPNALASDPRLHRVDRNRWALAEWGFTEYRGIAEAIAHQVDDNGGSIPLDVLTHRLVQQFAVAASSVRAYASGPPFVVEQGVVKRSSRGRDSASGKSWKKTRRVYRRSDGMAIRITVTSDHMRGSGSPCPIGLARKLGLSQGEIVQFAAGASNVGVYWTRAQPSFGSISPLLQKTDAEIGDTLIVLFQPNEQVDTWVADTDGLPASEQLSRLIARESSDHDVTSLSGALAFAIGMPPESGPADLVAALESRGDHDVAELFLSLRETKAERAAEPPTSVDVEDILDLLS